MIAMKLGWLVLEGLFLWFFLYFGSSSALALAVIMVLIPLLSVPANLVLRRAMEVAVESAGSLRKGDTGTLTVKLRNSALLPAIKVVCQVTVDNQLNREQINQRLYTFVFPMKEQRSTLHIRSEYCGRLRIHVEKLKLYDCFGLVGIPCSAAATSYITVQPETFEPVVQLTPELNSSDDSDAYSQNRPGYDMTETYQIREYIPGDSPKQIHWKLTNKLDRLVVRDPGLPITRNVLVFWERTGETGDPSRIDAQAEVVISLCRSLMDSGIQFTLAWNDTDQNLLVRHFLKNMDELVAVIPRLLRATGSKEAAGGVSLLLQTGMDALCGHMVYIAEEPQSDVMELQRYGHVTMLLCGETALDGAIRFDPYDYPQQLAQIEI